MAGRRERRTLETRERIYRAALELFAERGMANVTVEQITERADVGKGTFFNYFPSKESVLDSFGADQVDRLQHALLTGAIHGEPYERAQQVLQVLAGHPQWTPDLARNLFLSALRKPDVPGTEGPQIWKIEETLADIIRDGQRSGEFRTEVTAEEAASFLLGQHFLALLSWCTGFTEKPLGEINRLYSVYALEGLCVRSPGGSRPGTRPPG
jgi:AcrR family transcriptional regulator